MYEWDFTRFNPAYFAHVEACVDKLAGIGVEADLILFHPYDGGFRIIRIKVLHKKQHPDFIELGYYIDCTWIL